MTEEKKLNLQNEDFNVELEVYEVSSSTVLEAMGASNGHNSCSVVVTK
ncbi:thiopeptide-type bacteriocin [Cytobacillus sp. Hm23]